MSFRKFLWISTILLSGCNQILTHHNSSFWNYNLSLPHPAGKCENPTKSLRAFIFIEDNSLKILLVYLNMRKNRTDYAQESSSLLLKGTEILIWNRETCSTQWSVVILVSLFVESCPRKTEKKGFHQSFRCWHQIPQASRVITLLTETVSKCRTLMSEQMLPLSQIYAQNIFLDGFRIIVSTQMPFNWPNRKHFIKP